MEIERSVERITDRDLQKLYEGSMQRLQEYFVHGSGSKWRALYDIENPLAVALCQGAAMHYYDGLNGVKDFDVWCFYPFNERHLPYRTIWNWDYRNAKFGRHPSIDGYSGRKVDTIVRSIRNYVKNDPARTIEQYLKKENTASAHELGKKSVVLLHPEEFRGNVVWQGNKT